MHRGNGGSRGGGGRGAFHGARGAGRGGSFAGSRPSQQYQQHPQEEAPAAPLLSRREQKLQAALAESVAAEQRAATGVRNRSDDKEGTDAVATAGAAAKPAKKPDASHANNGNSNSKAAGGKRPRAENQAPSANQHHQQHPPPQHQEADFAGKGHPFDRLQFGYSYSSADEAVAFHRAMHPSAALWRRQRSAQYHNRILMKSTRTPGEAPEEDTQQQLEEDGVVDDDNGSAAGSGGNAAANKKRGAFHAPKNCEPLTAMIKLKRHWALQRSLQKGGLAGGAGGDDFFFGMANGSILDGGAADGLLELLASRQLTVEAAEGAHSLL